MLGILSPKRSFYVSYNELVLNYFFIFSYEYTIYTHILDHNRDLTHLCGMGPRE